MNRQRHRAVAIAAALTGVFLLSTCQQFFTTSLASPLARDSYPIPDDISLADAVTLLDAAIAEGDAVMAEALVPGLFAASEAALLEADATAYNTAATALVSAVVLSSGVGPVIATVASLFLAEDEETDLDELVSQAIEAVSAIALNEAELDALLMVADNPPEGLSADDAYTTAFALVANAYVEAGIDLASITEFSLDAAPSGVDPESLAAAEALMLYAESLPSDDGSTSIFASYFSELGLIAP